MFSKTILILLMMAYFASAGEVNFSDCSPGGFVEKVTMDGCEKNDCTIPLGRNVSFSFTLATGSQRMDRLESRASIVLGSDLDYKIDATPIDPCQELRCPLTENYHATYHGSITVPKSFPIIPVPKQFKFLLRESAIEVLCFYYSVNLTA